MYSVVLCFATILMEICSDLRTRGWTKTLNKHMHKIRALLVSKKSVWNAQGCQALTTLTNNEAWCLPLNLAFSEYNVKFLHLLFATIQTSSLFDTSHLLGLDLFVRQCQQWIRCIIVLQHFPSMPAFKRSNCVCRIQCGWHPSASMRDWDGTADCLAPLVWGHVKWLDCHPWHFPGKKKHGVSAKLMVGEVRVFGWTLHIQKYVNGHMNFPDCCCIVRFVSLIWGTLWNDAKNRFALGLCRCLACKHPTLGKDALCHALAMEHNPKHIFQHRFRWQHIFRVICVALCNWCSRRNCQMPTLQKRYCLLFCKYYSTCQNS